MLLLGDFLVLVPVKLKTDIVLDGEGEVGDSSSPSSIVASFFDFDFDFDFEIFHVVLFFQGSDFSVGSDDSEDKEFRRLCVVLDLNKLGFLFSLG